MKPKRQRATAMVELSHQGQTGLLIHGNCDGTRGSVPRAMEDTWFAFVDGDTLHAEENRDPSQYTQTDDEADVRFLLSLIDGLSLNEV